MNDYCPKCGSSDLEVVTNGTFCKWCKIWFDVFGEKMQAVEQFNYN